MLLRARFDLGTLAQGDETIVLTARLATLRRQPSRVVKLRPHVPEVGWELRCGEVEGLTGHHQHPLATVEQLKDIASEVAMPCRERLRRGSVRATSPAGSGGQTSLSYEPADPATIPCREWKAPSAW